MNVKKFQAVKFKHFGPLKHGFWNGNQWDKSENSNLFHTRQEAERVSISNGGRGEIIAIIIEL